MAFNQEFEARLRAALADRYTIEGELGRGGMATVYLAQDLKHERKVALKVLSPELSRDLGGERFLREIKTAANLTHPHILPLFDSGEADGFLYYVMPFVKGESLRVRLTRERQLPVEDALQIAREIADALAYAHREGVIHRDVKPANIMLEEGHAVLSDFGVAHAVAEAREERITRTGLSLGTPTYMSPEQATGGRELDGRTDQYALGCVLYEMLTGYPPFTAVEVEAVVRQHLTVEPPSVTEARPSVPAEVEKVIHRALAKAPADRFRTTEEMAAAFGTVTETRAHKVAPRRSPRRWIAGLTTGALAVAALVVWRPWVRDEGPMAAVGPPPWTILAEPEGSAPEETRGLVKSLLASGIDETTALRVLPEDLVRLGLERIMRPDTTRLTAEVAKELAEVARIGPVILPTLDRVGNVYALAVRALKVPGDTLLAVVRGTASGENALLTACNEATEDLASELAGTSGAHRQRSIQALPMTFSMDAYRKFEEAGRLSGDRRMREATRVLGEALEIDPGFARAWVRLGSFYSQLGMSQDSSEWALREALKHPERLDEYTRLRAEAELTGDRLQVLQFEQRWHSQTGILRSSLADGFLFAGDWDQAAASLEEIRRQSPFDRTNFYNWAYALVMLGRTEEARSLLPEMRSGFRATVRRLIASREGDWTELERDAVGILDDPTTEPMNGAYAGESMASVYAARGQVNEAYGALREIRQIRQEAGIGYGRRETSRFVLTMASESPFGDYALNELPPGTNEWDRVWDGLWAVEVGDTALARSYLTMLPEPELPAFGRPRALPALIRVLQARLAAKHGNWAEALSLLEAVTGDRSPIVSGYFDEQPRNQLAHWTLAEVQEHLGEFGAAASTFAGVAAGEQFGWSDMWNLGLTYSFAHRRAALLYGRLGENDNAIEHWRVFLNDFTDPDPEFEWMVEEAWEELGSLGG